MSDAEFERRIAAALHAAVPSSVRARQAIMERVRQVAPHEMPRRRPSLAIRRTGRHSIIGLALAAGIGSITTMSTLLPVGRGAAPVVLATAVIGDTVDSTLRDTLRLVRLMFEDSAAHRVAAVGDFNSWRGDATPLRRDPATRRWSATVALRDGAQRYAFVVDGTRWALDPAAEHVRGDDGRVFSLLHVARTSN
ncbi:MAG: putative glucosidase [Gemmatimonadetes bacterium]|nr:putative glucosidase [Gemmatimonadota bacterium]